jgi:glucuronosyltransferase
VVDATDWVEHVLATRGEAYLRTPDDDLPLLVRLSVDVWAACLGAFAILSYIAATAVCAAAHKLGRAHVNGTRKKAL